MEAVLLNDRNPLSGSDQYNRGCELLCSDSERTKGSNWNAIPKRSVFKYKLNRKPIRVPAASLRGRHLHPDCFVPFATASGALAIGPSRPIEEERRMQALVRDNNVDQALKVLKKKMQREGVFR